MDLEKEAPPNVVTEPRFRDLVASGYRVEVVCKEDAFKKGPPNWHGGVWIMRAVSDDGIEKLLVTARTRTSRNDIKIREIKTVTGGVISFLQGIGFSHADVPLEEGKRTVHKLSSEEMAASRLSALFLSYLGLPASADMVLVMAGGDGSLSPSRAQERFARNYNDGGVGVGSASDGLRILGEERRTERREGGVRVAAMIPRALTPRPDILAAIEETGLRYASHPGLRAADITVTDWLHLYRANIEIESAYNPHAVSHVGGAVGLGQLMPDTARALAVDPPHDWKQNLDGSARYLALMLAEFGDARLALAAYNAGPDAVREHSGIPPFRETQNHVQRVLAVFNRLEGASPP